MALHAPRFFWAQGGYLSVVQPIQVSRGMGRLALLYPQRTCCRSRGCSVPPSPHGSRWSHPPPHLKILAFCTGLAQSGGSHMDVSHIDGEQKASSSGQGDLCPDSTYLPALAFPQSPSSPESLPVPSTGPQPFGSLTEPWGTVLSLHFSPLVSWSPGCSGFCPSWCWLLGNGHRKQRSSFSSEASVRADKITGLHMDGGPLTDVGL